jgi:hypothetical protein
MLGTRGDEVFRDPLVEKQKVSVAKCVFNVYFSDLLAS